MAALCESKLLRRPLWERPFSRQPSECLITAHDNYLVGFSPGGQAIRSLVQYAPDTTRDFHLFLVWFAMMGWGDLKDFTKLQAQFFIGNLKLPINTNNDLILALLSGCVQNTVLSNTLSLFLFRTLLILKTIIMYFIFRRLVMVWQVCF